MKSSKFYNASNNGQKVRFLTNIKREIPNCMKTRKYKKLSDIGLILPKKGNGNINKSVHEIGKIRSIYSVR